MITLTVNPSAPQTSLTLSWSDSDQPACGCYRVYRSLAEKGPFYLLGNVRNTESATVSSTYTDSTAREGILYYYKIVSNKWVESNVADAHYPRYYYDQGTDPVIGLGPPTNYWMKIWEDNTQPRSTWTAPVISPVAAATQVVPELLLKVVINNFKIAPLATISQAGNVITVASGTFAFDEASKYAGAFILFEDGTTRTIVEVTSTTTATVTPSGTVTDQGFSLVFPGQIFHLFWFENAPTNPPVDLLAANHSHSADIEAGILDGFNASFGNVDGAPTFYDVVLPIESTEPYTKQIYVYVGVEVAGRFLLSPPSIVTVINPPP